LRIGNIDIYVGRHYKRNIVQIAAILI